MSPNARKKWKIALDCFGVASALICAVTFLVWLNGFAVEIVLEGQSDQIMEFGEHYSETSAQIMLKGRYFFKKGIVLNDIKPEISGDVQENRLGVYPLSYRAEFLLWQASADRTVRVIDTAAPIIELTEDSSESYIPGEPYLEPGFRATDNYDGDITHKVIRTEQSGLITYAVTDSSGNPAYAQREIPQYDPFPPEIRLKGGENYHIFFGQPFIEPGFTAVDDTDGDLTEYVCVEGSVDRFKTGTYPIRYTVSDQAMNETCIVRNVEVQPMPWPETQWPEEKTVYLTFDDGPGPHTMELLNILDKHDVKATFFVVDSGYDAIMKEIVNRGHSIGIHSVTHDYGEIYSSVDAYFADLVEMQEIIYNNTGVKTNLMRFPGGSSNLVSRRSCEGIMSRLCWAVRDAGFQYFDWNIDSEDAVDAKNKSQVRDNVIKGIQENGTGIVLQHDIHGYSVAAVEEIILWGKENGYVFDKIVPSTPSFAHDVLN